MEAAFRKGYDTLVVTAWAEHHYFGKDELADAAPSLKTIEDALEIVFV